MTPNNIIVGVTLILTWSFFTFIVVVGMRQQIMLNKDREQLESLLHLKLDDVSQNMVDTFGHHYQYVQEGVKKRIDCINDLMSVVYEMVIVERNPKYTFTPKDVIKCKVYNKVREEFDSFCDFRKDSKE